MKVDIYNTDKKYNIIYADPPWTFKTYSNKGKGRSAEMHYSCMSKKDIQDLPINKIADKKPEITKKRLNLPLLIV